MQAVLLCICMATVLAVPFHVSFHTLLDSSLPLIHSTLAAVEVMFILDIYNNFRTGYYSATRACVVYNRRLVASRYARSHLLTDVLAALPVTLCWKVAFLASGADLSGIHRFPDVSRRTEVVDAYSLLQCAPGTWATAIVLRIQANLTRQFVLPSCVSITLLTRQSSILPNSAGLCLSHCGFANPVCLPRPAGHGLQRSPDALHPQPS